MGLVRIVIAVLFLAGTARADVVILVDDNNHATTRDGLTWETAFRKIQEGVAAAANAGGGEVWVARASYAGPTSNPVNADGESVGETLIVLPAGVHLYGGFWGHETGREQRDWVANPTYITSGPSRRGVFVSGDGAATIDGFTIRLCGAPGDGAAGYGGGLYNDGANLRVANCRFSGNAAAVHGGGLYNDGADLQVANCRFSGNVAAVDGGGIFNCGAVTAPISGVIFWNNNASQAGGGLYSSADSLTLVDCNFSNNHANAGGGLFLAGGEAALRQCALTGNAALDAGGGFYYEGGGAVYFTNVMIGGNTAGNRGGGLFQGASPLSLTHTTVARNDAPEGGGVYCGTLGLLNSILAENGAGNLVQSMPEPGSMRASCVEGIEDDESQQLIGASPRFIDAARLVFDLEADSPCLDAGADGAAMAEVDIAGVSRPQGAGPDMGALEMAVPGEASDSDGDALPDSWELAHFGNLERDGTGN